MGGENLETPGERLRWARAKAGYKTAEAAAKVLRMKPVSYRALENNQHGLTKHATDLARAYKVDVAWLVDGVGVPTPLADERKDQLTPETQHLEIEMIRKVDIAYAMGAGAVIQDYPEVEFLPFSLNFLKQFTRGPTENLFLASGFGDSMEPTLMRGDLLMIDTSQTRIGLADQIWALTYAGAGMIKRLRPMAHGVILILSDNPNVPPLEASVEDIHIVGKVVWKARVM
jgi:phage repressor protein C with HTH and peptisase S24 domain